MRRRYYIIFVAREKDGPLRKIPVPLHYAGVFIAAAVVGAFTITGMAGSYTRMLLKTASFNQVRSQREALRRDYRHLQAVAQEKDIQAASLGSLASEVTALYGLRRAHSVKAALSAAPAAGMDGEFSSADYQASLDQLSMLRSDALSGHIGSFTTTTVATAHTGWVNLPGAPSLWPVAGPVTSGFGEREDPLDPAEGEFHTGVDIGASFGTPVHATANGVVEKAGWETGYGRLVILNNAHGIQTFYAHLSGFAVTAGEQVHRGEVIGYVGESGRTTGPNLHYEVRINNTPVNPHPFLRETIQQMLAANTIARIENLGN
ncbi:MAG: M23 family metallopeptidase [Acidobacteriota bacterium]